MASNNTALVKPATTWSIAISVLMIVAGVIAISLPLMAGIAIDVVIAWLLILSGALHVAFAWRGHGAAGVIWEILLGLAYGVIGCFLLLRPFAGLTTLALAVAIYLSVEAALELALWFQLRGSRGRGWLMFDAIVTVVLAAMIWRTWPSSASWVVGTLVGLSMFFSGVTRLALSITARRLAP